MIARPLAAALLAAAALALVACGGDDPETPASASTSEEQKAREAQLKFAECMRENGVDMPDPDAEGRTRLQIGPESDITPEEFEKAEKACEQYREDIRPNLSEEDKQEVKEQALAHARCMREHGIDVPDPTFSAEGGVQMRMPGNIDPDDPDFKAAQEACEDLRPELKR
jgi:hypothetical protein